MVLKLRQCWFKFVVFLREQGPSQSGLALILVLSMITIMLSIIAENIFQSELASRTAVGERDKLNAEMAAITGVQFAKMLVALDSTLKSLPPEVMQMMGGALGNKKVYEFLNGLPIGADGLDSTKELTKLNISDLLDRDFLAALKIVPGYFVVNVINESAKLNVNNLAIGSSKKGMQLALMRLFSTPREAKFLEDKGFAPKQLVANLMDYVTAASSESGGGLQQYELLKFLHGPKQGPLQSMEELRRIPGFHDDEIYEIFSPYLTVWPLNPPDSRVLDFHAAPIEMVTALLTKEGSEPNEAALDKLEEDRAEGKLPTLAAQGDKPGAGDRDFKKYIEQASGGVSIDSQLFSLFGTDSNVFRVEVRGVSNGVERTYELVLDRSKPKAKSAKPGDTKDSAPVRVLYQRYL